MVTIPTSIVKRVPYLGPVISGVGLILDVKDIVETATPVNAAKIIAGCLVNECTPSKLLIAGKCFMLVGSRIVSVNTSGNLLLVSSTLPAARSIVRA